MERIKPVVIGVTIYLFIFAMTPSLGLVYDLIFTLFMIGNFLLIYMVYVVLKYGVASKKKFNDGYWYEDVDRPFGQG